MTVSDEEWEEALAKADAACKQDRQTILEMGGLHVLGTSRHEARRIDNQLRGRAGRQGDPGSSRYYVSLEDDLMRRMGGATGLMDKVWVEEDMPIEHNIITDNAAGTGVAGVIGVATTAVLVIGLLWGVRAFTGRRRNPG